MDPDNWAENNVSFLCKMCISQCGTRSEKLYHLFLKFLRYSMNASTDNFSLVAQEIENILEVYQDIIPTCPSIQVIETPFEYDSIAISILKFFHPVMLNNFFPSPVLGDGNCLFRAVSKSIYRTEDEHFRLRLLLSLEIL